VARPHGCFGCATGLSSFAVDGDDQAALRLTGEVPPGSVDAQLQQYGLFTDLGLEFAAMKAMLATLSQGDEVDEAKLARKTALGNGPRHCFVRHRDTSPAPARDGGYPSTDRSGCLAGGYVVIPRMGDEAVPESPAGRRLRLLAAVADSAGLCPFVLENLEVEGIAELLSAATGVDYSPAEVWRAGERIVRQAHGNRG